MIIELAIHDVENILLTPVRKEFDGENNDKTFLLVDDTNKSWMEVQLVDNSFKLISQSESISENEDDVKMKLDKLVLEVIEAEQSGTENSESEFTEEASPYDPDDIRVSSKQFSVKLIDQMIDNGDIDLNPDFQRNFVWTSIQKSRLIESILLRIPLPMFYFAEEEDGLISVVDGLQRLTTIKEFMDNKFPLKNLEYLKDTCEGKYYSAKNGKPHIDPKYFRWFNMTQFSVNVIDPTSPPKVKYDIFRRINTGGKPLNNQEIRNCLAGKDLRAALKKMANSKEFKIATDWSIKPTRMDDQEVALRFIRFYKFLTEDGSIEKYDGYMDSTLDELTEQLSKPKAVNFDIYTSAYSNAMKKCRILIWEQACF